jgi:hypothetical protein
MKHFNNGVTTISFTSFGRSSVGRVVTEDSGFAIVNSRNPYGSHNLVVVDLDNEVAVAHGIDAALREAFYSSRKTYRKVRRFLSEKMPGTVSWVVTN